MNEGDRSIGMRGTEGHAVEGRAIVVNATVPRALREGELPIGAIRVPCYALADGTALLTGAAILAVFAVANNRHFGRFVERIPVDSGQIPLWPEVRFRAPSNNAIAVGYRADVVVDVCDLYIRALAAGTLHPKQMPLAIRAAVVSAALGKVGITALIWEATGYDKVKAAGALQDKLALVLREEAGAWEQLFPHEFFVEVARLYRLELRADGRRPMVFAAFLAEFFYEWFDAEVYDAMKRRNPRRPELDGERRHRHHQFLTPPARARFVQHRGEVLRLMRATPHLADFRMRFDAAYRGAGLQLAFGGV